MVKTKTQELKNLELTRLQQAFNGWAVGIALSKNINLNQKHTIKRQLSCCHKMIWNVAILLCYMLNGCFDLGGWMGLSF